MVPAVLITKQHKMGDRKNILVLDHQPVMFAERNQELHQVVGLTGHQQNIMYVRIYPHVTK